MTPEARAVWVEHSMNMCHTETRRYACSECQKFITQALREVRNEALEEAKYIADKAAEASAASMGAASDSGNQEAVEVLTWCRQEAESIATGIGALKDKPEGVTE